ncbi:uncharacterized protein ETH_00035720, partial [Eimeria tenella]
MQSFVCCALELPGAAAAATGDVPPYTAAQKQLKLVKAMLQHGADNKEVQQQLFAQMQRQLDLEGCSYVAAAQRSAAAAEDAGDAAAAAAAGGEGRALGWWSITSVHSDLMKKIWRALRIFYYLTTSLPPLQLAVFLAQNQPEVQSVLRDHSSSSSSSNSSSSSSSGGRGLLGGGAAGAAGFGSRGVEASLREHERQQQQLLLEWGRQDPLGARQLLQQQQKLQVEKERQRGVQQQSFLQPQRAIDYPRLFGYTDLLLLPF